MLYIHIGPSGSGKTKTLVESIRHDIENKTRAYLLVPEQQAYISERDLPKYLPENAGLYFEILNFTGLAEKVFHDLGSGQPKRADQSVKMLLMWNVLRTLSPVLSRYQKKGKSEGSLANQMIATVEDLRASGISPEDLSAAKEEVGDHSLLAQKLSDLAAVYELYEGKRAEVFGKNDAEEALTRLAALLTEHRYFDGAHIYVDSFTSFTADEYKVLEALLRMADVSVTLTIDALPSCLPHFKRASDTGRQLKRRADRADVKWEVVPHERPTLDTPLSYLEKNVWNFAAPKYEKEIGDAVHALAAKTLYEECEATALNILELHQNGTPYDEIAVIVRDVETYRGWLDAVLDRYHIPYFLSRRNDFAAKSPARLILSALRAVCHAYRATDVLSLLKTGLAGVSTRDAAFFEEYVETWHINGKRFLDNAWSMNPDGLTTITSDRGNEILAAANAVRAAVIEPLKHLSLRLNTAKHFSEFCRALYDYLLEIRLPDTLVALAEEELRRGEQREAEETVRLFAFFRDALKKAVSLLGEEEINPEDFLSVLSLYFGSLDMGSVPLTNDCVMIGSASTLRVENVRAVLILGLFEGEFPDSYASCGLLTDEEKDRLAEISGQDVDAASVADLHNSEELFFVYRAMTKPTERLILSRPLCDAEGNRQEASIAFKHVAYDLFDLKDEIFDKRALGTVSVQECAATSDRLNLSLGDKLKISASKVETFAKCPYSYFSTYTLRAREKKDSLQGAAESGNFFHHVFERLLSMRFAEKEEDCLDEANLEAALSEIVEEYFREICPFPDGEPDAALLQMYWKMQQIAAILAHELIRSFEGTDFVPAFFEEKVGEGAVPALTITLDNGKKVQLTGKIDRIDLCKIGDRTYLRVVDYKSSEKKFDLDSLKKGEQIQLLFYLYAATREESGFEAAGAKYLYYKNDGSWKFKESGFQLVNEDLKSETDKLTACSKEEIEGLKDTFEETVKSVCARIFEGEIKKTPSEDACEYCPLRNNCNVASPKKNY